MARASGLAVLAPLGANECPVCRGVHGTPGDWPTCPHHEHRLRERKVTGDGIQFGCPAPGCEHIHTQQERPTMTATEAVSAALAIRPEQELFTAKQLAALAQLGIKDASNADLAVFMHYCQRTGLDPFARQIYMISRRVKDGDKWAIRQTIQVGIDGYRVIAQRAARRDGVTLSYGNTTWYDQEGKPYAVWVSPIPPSAAAVTVYRDGKPFPGVARLSSFATFDKDGNLTGKWAAMPDHMIAKCAEAQALRRAFPHDLAGIQTDDETAHLDVPPPRPAPAITPPRRRQPDPAVIEATGVAIGKQFDRLEVEDTEEREAWVRKLNQDAEGELTEHQLRFALGALSECEDYAALVDLCSPEPEAS